MRGYKGITLIALVITIVILIILAGVAINLSLGENGIFKKAKQATQEYSNAQAKEETEMAKLTNEIENEIKGNRDLAGQTPGTATASDILKGKIAWVNGEKITGTLENISSGEAWLIANKEIMNPTTNISVFKFINIDLTKIKTISYHLSDGDPCCFIIRSSTNGDPIYVGTSTTSTTVNIEQYWDSVSNIVLQINLIAGATFYIDGYTK